MSCRFSSVGLSAKIHVFGKHLVSHCDVYLLPRLGIKTFFKKSKQSLYVLDNSSEMNRIKMTIFNTPYCFVLFFFFFSEQAVLRKFLDIRFLFKHCNFSRCCLLFKMASKTLMRLVYNSIIT